MSNPGKGGRGKRAPYETIHYRIPIPIKTLVEKLASTYKWMISTGGDEQTNQLLTRVDAAISNDDKQDRLQPNVYDGIIANLENELAIARQEIEKLKLEKQEVISILVPALEIKANAGGKIKDAIRTALSRLDE